MAISSALLFCCCSAPQPRASVDVSSTSSFPSLGASSAAAAGGTPTSATRSTARVQQQYQPPPVAAHSPAPVNFAVQALEGSAGSRSNAAPDSPASRLLGSVSSGGGSLHVDAPVVAPVALPVAAPVAAPVTAPVTASMTTTAPLVPVAAPVVAPVGVDGPARLMQAELRAGSTGPGSAVSLASAAGSGRAPAVPVTGPLSLMDRILKHRAEAEAAAGVSAAGSDGGGGGGSGVVSTSTGAAASRGSNGGCKKGGLLKSLTQVRLTGRGVLAGLAGFSRASCALRGGSLAKQASFFRMLRVVGITCNCADSCVSS